MKRISSFLLVIVILIAALPCICQAADTLNPRLTDINLRPSCAGIYFGAELAGDTTDVVAWGVAMSTATMPDETNMNSRCLYTRTTNLEPGYGVLLTDILEQSNSVSTNLYHSAIRIYSRAYAELSDGTLVFGEGIKLTLKQLLRSVNEIADTLDDTQLEGISAMYGDYINLFYQWDLTNLHQHFGKGRALNSLDADALDISVQVLEESSYQGVDLVSRMYQHAFTCKLISYLPENALEKLADGSASSTLKAMVVKCEDLTENKLMTGDVIFAGDDLYLYGGGSLRSLNSSGAPKVNTAKTLAAISDFTLLRPANGLPSLKRADVTAPKDKLTPQQEALISTATAYWLRGERLQYADTRFIKNGRDLEAEFRWQSTVNAPEDCTLTDWGYTNCAVFTYEVYYQTFGYKLPGDMYTTANLAKYAAENGMEVYAYERAKGSTQTAEEQAQVKEEFLSTLQPGDIICIRRENSTGHALLYIGNDQILHSSGSTYTYTDGGEEAYEASIRRTHVENYFFNPAISSGGDVFSKGTKLSIIRPLNVMSNEITENTRNRMENLENIIAEKLSSHVRAQTADHGQEITFTYAMHNIGNQEATLEIRETVPSELEWVSGGDRSGDTLTWTVTVPAGKRASVSYTAKVKDSVAYGTEIQSTDSTVGGVTVKCEPITVGKTLTDTQQTALIQAYKDAVANGTELTGLALVNELYKQATGVENIFASTTHKTVTEGTEGCFVFYTTNASSSVFKLNPDGDYAKLLVPSLYGGYRLWASEFANDRTRLAKEQDLQIGDVLLGRVSTSVSSVTRPIYLYLGEEIGFINMNSLQPDTVSVSVRLERLLAYDYYYAIMRPMQALQ